MKIIDNQYISEGDFTVLVIPSIKVEAEQIVENEFGDKFKVSGLTTCGRLILQGKSAIMVPGKFVGQELKVV